MTITRMEFDKLKQQVLNLLRELDSIGGLAEVLVTGADISVSQLSAISADMGSITAGTITGGTLRTAASGARVVLDSAGLKCYDATAQRGQILNDGSGWFGASTAFSWTSAGVVSIDGNKLNTGSVANGALAGGITYDKLSVTQLSAVSANLGTITSGSITGVTISQAAGAVVINASGLAIKGQYAEFMDSGGTTKGWLFGTTSFRLVANAVTTSIEGGGALQLAAGGTVRVNIESGGDINHYGHTIKGSGNIVPTEDNQGSVGTASLRWSLVRAVTITPGDIIFANEFTITEDGPDALVFLNPDRVPIMRLDRGGNLELAGHIGPQAPSRGPIPRPVLAPVGTGKGPRTEPLERPA